MNLTKLKNFAPAARTAFIDAVTRRAGVLGIQKGRVEPVTESGDVALIGGQPFPRSVVPLRKKLLEIIQRDGFGPTMEAMAYTWFNRLVALRFMELHDGYLDHGYRVLSHPQGTALPEILQHAEHVSLKGLDREEVIRLKLDGNRDEELYRLLLLAQCAELNHILPDVFSKLDDATILLLPDNLLHSDSVIRQLVAGSDAEDWQQVEVLGWLYQFYISEKKDAVMARKSAVPTEDIPAVTQLFTPHWIVRYLVENSLGRLWLLNRPGSRLREHMPYYIEEVPSDQSSVISGEENAPRQSTAPSDLFSSTDHCSLTTDHSFLRITKPEDIKLLDPASGSGHMLTYAFDLLVLIYEEEGYAANDIPGLILKHNLHGTEICPRAAQLAELALVFKAREKSRRFFSPGNLVRPNIIELQNVRFEENELREYFQALGVQPSAISPNLIKLLHQFEEAKNFGSLIQPCLTEAEVQNVRLQIQNSKSNIQNSADLMVAATHLKVLRVLEQAEALTQRYHVVVANPPYMGIKAQNAPFRVFAKNNFPKSGADLFAMFIERTTSLAVTSGYIGMVTMQSWMFLGTYEEMRKHLLTSNTLVCMAHLGARAFDSLSGEVVQTTAFAFRTGPMLKKPAVFQRLLSGRNEREKEDALLRRDVFYRASTKDLQAIPGWPIAYWVSAATRRLFETSAPIEAVAVVRGGMTTGSNDLFVRFWFEPGLGKIGFGVPSRDAAVASRKKWFPYNKGGEYRKWYGNNLCIVNWENDGEEILRTGRASPRSKERYFQQSITWTDISSGSLGIRFSPPGFLFDASGPSVFAEPQILNLTLAQLVAPVTSSFLDMLNPTLHVQAGDICRLPSSGDIFGERAQVVIDGVSQAIAIARADWDNFETSWDFRDQPLLRPGLKGATLEASWRNWEAQSTTAIRRMQELETENNRLFIAAYGLGGELEPEVPVDQITLARAEAKKDIAAFLSYAIGCMMGRYSLDAEGLILADAGDTVEAYAAKIASLKNSTFSIQNSTFHPDTDGIIPLLDGEWFEDDLVARTKEFLRATFGEATLSANIAFIETSLGKDLRTYFLNDFYKDHLQTYKNRPIYWLFSSGKQKAFQCLVYLHRYTPGTLARIRTEYAIPLQGKLSGRITRLEEGVANASSSAARKKLQTELDQCKKQIVELLAFDEQLRSHADQRITLDLDDGVKTNYAKFGPLLAEAKKVCGTKED